MNNIRTEGKEPLNPKYLRIIEVVAILLGLFLMLFDTLRYLGIINRSLLKITWGFFPNLIHPSVHFTLWLAFSIVWIAILAGIYYLASKSEVIRKSEYGIFKFIFHILLAILILFILKFVIILIWVLTGHVVPRFP